MLLAVVQSIFAWDKTLVEDFCIVSSCNDEDVSLHTQSVSIMSNNSIVLICILFLENAKVFTVECLFYELLALKFHTGKLVGFQQLLIHNIFLENANSLSYFSLRLML